MCTGPAYFSLDIIIGKEVIWQREEREWGEGGGGGGEEEGQEEQKPRAYRMEEQEKGKDKKKMQANLAHELGGDIVIKVLINLLQCYKGY